MSYTTKTFTVRLNWRQLEALQKLKDKNPLASRNKIITSCIMWKASDIVEQFEILEKENERLKERDEKFKSIIRMHLFDTWEYYIKNNAEVRAIKGPYYEEYKTKELDRIFELHQIWISNNPQKPMPIKRRFGL
jgi:hypothetical protein